MLPRAPNEFFAPVLFRSDHSVNAISLFCFCSRFPRGFTVIYIIILRYSRYMPCSTLLLVVRNTLCMPLRASYSDFLSSHLVRFQVAASYALLLRILVRVTQVTVGLLLGAPPDWTPCRFLYRLVPTSLIGYMEFVRLGAEVPLWPLEPKPILDRKCEPNR